jgi:hypothetical protein
MLRQRRAKSAWEVLDGLKSTWKNRCFETIGIHKWMVEKNRDAISLLCSRLPISVDTYGGNWIPAGGKSNNSLSKAS